MNPTGKAAVWAVAVSVLCSGVLVAGAEGRISGRVTDADGAPIKGAEVALVNPQSGAEEVKKTDKKGKVVFLVLDATVPYGIRITKDGYQPIQERVVPVVGSTLRKEWQLAAAVQAASGGAQSGGEVQGSAAAIRLYNAGATANNEGDRATAIEKFRAAIDADPAFVPGHQALLGLYIQSSDHANALAVADELIGVAPTDVMALGARYDALVELGRTEEAEAALEAMVLSAPGPATAVRLFNRGATSLRDGKIEAAVPDLKLAVEMDPGLEVARSALATVFLSLKEYQKAAESAQGLLDLEPENAVGLSILYEAYRGLGETARAQETFAALQRVSPEKAADAFYSQGVALLDQGKPQDALASFEKVLASNPGHRKVHYMLGLCYLNTSQMDAAKGALEKFLELAPDDPDAASAREMLAALE